MSLLNLSESTVTPATTKQQERAQRILDAAAELILRWGYDKTTVDDIAQKAGVAKGTIYLHWKTREELFEALLRRESLELGQDFRQRITQDPAGATLRGIYKHAALALIRRPLLKAVLLGDREIIGRLARSEQNQSYYASRWAGFTIYLDFLRSHDIIRTDISIQEQAYAVTAIFVGYFLAAPLISADRRLPDETMANLIGDTIHRTLETPREVPAAELQRISDAFIAFLDHSLESVAKGAPAIKENTNE
jgi:AcrR family transcriptional regulator